MSSHPTQLPTAFATRMQQLLGDAFPAFQAALGQKTTSIRYNTLKMANEPIGTPIAWCKMGRYLAERPVFTLDPLFHAGQYYVQDASSMFLEQLFDQVIPKDQALQVLDLCAAPGGKSTHLSSLMPEGSLLLANEVIKSRCHILQENLMKWGSDATAVCQLDTSNFKGLQHFFDLILIDAPCSGEGMFGKNEKALQEWSPAHVTHCAARQKRILANALPLLKKEGYLIYATCTYALEENEQQLQWLMEEYALESVSLNLEADWGVKEVTVGESSVAYRFYPHLLSGGGLFMAILRKKEGASQPKKAKFKKGKKEPIWQKIAAKQKGFFEGWVQAVFLDHIYQYQDQFYYLPPSIAPSIQQLSATIALRSAGICLGSIKGNKLVPDHHLAMSTIIHPAVQRIELMEDQAILYLKKQALSIDGLPVIKGWALATYQSLPLGWMKVLNNRMNNYYPKHFRIRNLNLGV